jgi:hypothetical protein
MMLQEYASIGQQRLVMCSNEEERLPGSTVGGVYYCVAICEHLDGHVSAEEAVSYGS